MAVTLRSNGGDLEVSVDVTGPQLYASEAGVDASVRLRGTHWDGDHTHDFEAAVEGLWLRLEDLQELRDYLASWLKRPLEQLDPYDLDAEFTLTRLPGQTFVLQFGLGAEASQNRHPEVTIAVGARRFRVEVHLVADQSCLALFRDGLSSYLANHASPS